MAIKEVVSKRAGCAPAVGHWHRTNLLIWGPSHPSLVLPSVETFSAGCWKMCGPKHHLTDFSKYLFYFLLANKVTLPSVW